jgi:hypothetical protein
MTTLSISCTLNTFFTKEDLVRFLASGSNIVVAKPSEGGPQGSTPNVAWVVFRPLESNTMTWTEEYGIYASNVELKNGALLTQLSRSEFPALDGKIYEFAPNGTFGAPSAGGEAGSFSVLNSYDNPPRKYLTFGLCQDATVNGELAEGNAISAATVLYQSTAVMTPYTTVYLWVQSQVRSNSVLTVVTSPMTKVTFGGTTTNISLAYDPATGKFIAKAGTTLADDVALSHKIPMLI